jgi:predicted 2-oxoglutarate/Fe(II)-dependent dioxygenase YbiX
MLFVRSDFCAPVERSRIRAAIENGHMLPAEIYADGYRSDQQARRAYEVEVGEDVIVDVQHAFDAVRSEVARFFDIPLTGNEGPGFLRYLAGGFYRRHCDILDEFPRRISVVLFLTTSGIESAGGALRIYRPDAFDIVPEAGTLVAFPADVPHEVLPVTAGVRDVVVDWFY